MMIKHALQKANFQILIRYYSSQSKQLTTQIPKDLATKLQSMQLRLKKSIFIEQPLNVEIEGGKNKKNKYVYKVLTKQQKQQLGIYIPRPTFPLRMTKKLEQEYRPALCEQLYAFQHNSLSPYIRVLQLPCPRANIDSYINAIYKDIFVRYLLARGLGVEWEANYSDLGFVNPKQQLESNPNDAKLFYQWVLDLIQEYPLNVREILGLYSYSQKRFAQVEEFQVQNVYKIGYYFTLPLTKFGKFQQNFEIIQKRGQKIDVLFMVEDPVKLINMQGLVFEPGTKMIILSKSALQQIDENDFSFENKSNSYLVTSLEIFNEHKDFFTKSGYRKHTTFDSQLLTEMQSGNLKFYPQIDGYSRKPGIYLMDSYSGLPDFQRKQTYEQQYGQTFENKIKQYVDQNACLWIQGEIVGKITDTDIGEKVLKRFQNKGQLKQLQIYGTYSDQIYSLDGEKLHFRVAPKYYIPIPQNFYEQLDKAFEKAVVSESKVVIPSMNKHYPQPKDRRMARKKLKQAWQQKTTYMSLQQSLQTFDSLSFSTLQKQSPLQFPIFVKVSENKEEEILINNKIKEIILESMFVSPKTQSQQLQISWNLNLLNQHIETLSEHFNSEIKVKWLNLSKNLLTGYKCLKSYQKNPELSNVVIEPQSKTEDIVPYFFHLHFMIYKMMSKNNPQQRGRRNRNKIQKFYADRIFSLVKFHPTIVEEQRKRSVQEIIHGVIKANNQKQYGYGLQALRFWVARQDSYLGDRKLIDKQVNKQLQLGAFIRKMYWQILPMINVDLSQIPIPQNPPENYISEQQVISQQIPRHKLTYLHRFMLDHINFYILNMQQCYKKLNLSKALNLTEDFFKNYLEEIFVKTARKRMITYPLAQETKQHVFIFKKILSLAAVIAPLLPFSMYHVSKVPSLKWPDVDIKQVQSEQIPTYNRMTKLRVQLRNKVTINKFHHSELFLNLSKNNQNLYNMSSLDLQLFFGIDNISVSTPTELGKNFKLKLSSQHPIGQIQDIKVYQYKDVCIRCSPNRNYGTHICQKCLDYLSKNYGKQMLLN